LIKVCFASVYADEFYASMFQFQIFDSGQFWANLPQNVRDNAPKLVRLLARSRADSTVKQYSAEITKFQIWRAHNSLPVNLPIDISTVVAYIHHRFLQSNSPSVAVTAHAALKWLHSFFPVFSPNPLDSSLCRALLEGIRRARTTPIQKKVPLSPEALRKILDKYAAPEANLKDLRLACICAIGFSGFFRFNELANILIQHIERYHDHISIFIPRSKTDVYREGNHVFIKRLANKYCPVSVLERYLQAGNVDPTSSSHLFRPLRWFKSESAYRLYGSKLPYTRCREIFKEGLESLGYDSSHYGLHSLRSGGATAAVLNNPSISERLLKLHRRWKSSAAKDMYIQESVQKRLEITGQLGL
jgi:hypothetical protein